MIQSSSVPFEKSAVPGPTISLNPHSERAGEWRIIFGRLDHIPVHGYAPVLADLPDRPRSACYMLDLARITVVERILLVSVLAKRFKLSPRLVEHDLDRYGCPIPATDTLTLIPAHFASKWSST